MCYTSRETFAIFVQNSKYWPDGGCPLNVIALLIFFGPPSAAGGLAPPFDLPPATLRAPQLLLPLRFKHEISKRLPELRSGFVSPPP